MFTTYNFRRENGASVSVCTVEFIPKLFYLLGNKNVKIADCATG